MKKIIACFLMLLSQQSFAQLNVTPAPAEVKMGTGNFILSADTKIILEGSNLEKSAVYLTSFLKKNYGLNLLTVTHTSKKITRGNAIVLNYERLDGELPGAYVMQVNDKQVYIAGDNEEGVFYGIQTLLQLIPVKSTLTGKKNYQLSIPQLSITDQPRFAYRGSHLDVSRHFFTVEEVKKHIDHLATYKYNTFHWHLTDDQGWRIEIKKYPKLTTVGGYRNGTIIGRYPGKGNDSIHYGGYYTQQQIKEVVKYAADRYIEVIPEIEMPGHASAAIAAYPELSCFPEEDTKILETTAWAGSRKGKQVQQTWGVFEDVFVPSENTFKFLQNVIDEIIPLFPSKYIHIGGDECPKASWKRSAFCQKLIADNKLGDEHGLQSYFINRMEKYINQKGKKIIGWDEILEGGLAPNAAVMSWRGEAGGIAAAKEKHNVIMTPEAYCYLDHSQSKNEDSVTIGGYTPLDKVYSYNPLPAALTKEQSKFILGAQVNVWTEYIGNQSKLEYTLFPRMIAFSEVLWSSKEKRDWKDFEKRLPVNFERLAAQNINYSKAYFDFEVKVLPNGKDDGVMWSLSHRLKNGRVTVSLPGIFIPKEQLSVQDSLDLHSVKETHRFFYTRPFEIERSGYYRAWLEDSLAEGDRPYFADIEQKFSLNLATGRKISLAFPPAEKYAGDGAFTLVNGIQNKMGLVRSTEFLGFSGTDAVAVIDLGKNIPVSEIVLHVFEQTGSWIYRPAEVSFYAGIDSSDLQLLETVTNGEGKAQLTYNTKKTTNARFVKIVAKNYGTIPQGKQGAGSKAWLFLHEIEIH